MAGPLITLLTDFGARDPSAAICRAVIWSIAPEARLLDISHEVAKYAIRDGALLLWCALPYTEPAVHVAVVDPGVGTDRRPVAIRVGRGDTLVGPDNGLLIPVTERLGGVTEAHVLTSERHRLATVSTSFHGRDIFAPAAAHIALGVALEELGPPLDPADLVRLDLPEPIVEPGRLTSTVIYRDTFGNAKLGALGGQLPEALGGLVPGDDLDVAVAGRHIAATWQVTFGTAFAGAALLYEDSYGRLCLAVNQGSAVEAFGLEDDEPVVITRGSQAPRT
jgi:S-adenosylmethionine hydrolase